MFAAKGALPSAGADTYSFNAADCFTGILQVHAWRGYESGCPGQGYSRRLAAVAVLAWAGEVIAKVAQQEFAPALRSFDIFAHLLKASFAQLLLEVLLFHHAFDRLRRFRLSLTVSPHPPIRACGSDS